VEDAQRWEINEFVAQPISLHRRPEGAARQHSLARTLPLQVPNYASASHRRRDPLILQELLLCVINGRANQEDLVSIVWGADVEGTGVHKAQRRSGEAPRTDVRFELKPPPTVEGV
jgi:hypothetical protein